MTNDTRRVVVWDIFVRIIHWSLVILIPLAWWTYEIDDMEHHRLIGYAVLALLASRLLWGFAGSEPARFANFLRGPRQVAAYLSGRAPHHVGHNPLGGWSVVLLLALSCVQPLGTLRRRSRRLGLRSARGPRLRRPRAVGRAAALDPLLLSAAWAGDAACRRHLCICLAWEEFALADVEWASQLAPSRHRAVARNESPCSHRIAFGRIGLCIALVVGRIRSGIVTLASLSLTFKVGTFTLTPSSLFPM